MTIHAYAKFTTTKTAARRIAIRVLKREIRDRENMIAEAGREVARDLMALERLEAKK
jgi:hypothetical protein